MYYLQNELFRAVFNKKGAELCSLQSADRLEYIWQADPAIWPRHAPLLFPIVGRLKDNTYRLGENAYSLPQHGFARDRDFRCVSQSTTSLTFELQADEETEKVYPFLFRLQVIYTLIDNTLTTAYLLENTGEKELLFSIGAHPGFRCPLFEGEHLSDYYLEFEQNHLQRSLLSEGLLGEHSEKLVLSGNKLPLTHELFDADALVFADKQIKDLRLKSTRHSHEVRMTCEDWPWFGIWSKKGASPFVCLEPWMGITDGVNASGKLEEKAGIMKLAPNRDFHCSFTLSFF